MRFHKFPAGLHRGTMTKNTKTKTICKSNRKAARQEMKSTASVLRIKPGQNKKLAEHTHHQLKHHQRWERYEKERCQRSCTLKYEPVNHDDGKYCQFKYLTLLLMSIVTHIITQPAGPKDV